MRFDTPVYFQSIKQGKYNADTGNYEAEEPTEVKRYAAVTASKVETLNLVYGELKQDSLTIRLQMPYKSSFDRIRIGSKLYRVDFSRQLRYKHIFVVSEVQ